jgi:hypothetical protein
MADHAPTGPVELGADMDYAEHEKTYGAFIGLAKYGSLFVAALLIGMTFFFFGTSGGIISGLFSIVLFVVVLLIGGYILR